MKYRTVKTSWDQHKLRVRMSRQEAVARILGRVAAVVVPCISSAAVAMLLIYVL